MKRSYRDQLRDNDAAQRQLSALSGKPVPEGWLNNIGPKREIVNRTDPAELEAVVLRDVGKLLATHPKVLFAVRINSGAAWLPSKNGKDAPVFFYRIVRSRTKMRIVDYTGLTVDGRSIAIECKRAAWKLNPKDEREVEQLAYINTVRSTGGVGGFVTCVEQALAILEAA